MLFDHPNNKNNIITLVNYSVYSEEAHLRVGNVFIIENKDIISIYLMGNNMNKYK